MTASEVEFSNGWILTICTADRGMAYKMVGTFQYRKGEGREGEVLAIAKLVPSGGGTVPKVEHLQMLLSKKMKIPSHLLSLAIVIRQRIGRDEGG